MPHAVILRATKPPSFDNPLLREGATIHKIVEVTQGEGGWLLKSLILSAGVTTKFFVRIDRRDDGIVVRLDDHVHVERTPLVYDHLALIAKRVLTANEGSTLGPTNLEARILA